MATVYPTAAGEWSTRTWNDDATGAAYGMAPQAGDTVLANGLAITLDTNITVAALSTRVGTTAVAGGSFTTSGTRTITCDTYGGTTSCLILQDSSNSVHVGNSFGSNTTASMCGTTINATCTQNGNSTGGNGTSRHATLIQSGGTQNGNATGGSGLNALGSNVAGGGILNGNTFGGTATSAAGATIAAGAVQVGNSTGSPTSGANGTNVNAGGLQKGNSTGGGVSGAYGTGIIAGGVQIGDCTGGSASGAYGTNLVSGIFNGNAIGGSVSGAHGVFVTSAAMAFVSTATGNTAGAFGVYSGDSARYVAIIKAEAGSYPKSLTASAETSNTNVPFTSFSGIPIARGMHGGMR